MINSAQNFQLIIEVILVCVGFAFFPLYYWCIKLCSCNSRSQSDARLKTSANWARTLSRALNFSNIAFTNYILISFCHYLLFQGRRRSRPRLPGDPSPHARNGLCPVSFGREHSWRPRSTGVVAIKVALDVFRDL